MRVKNKKTKQIGTSGAFGIPDDQTLTFYMGKSIIFDKPWKYLFELKKEKWVEWDHKELRSTPLGITHKR